MNLIYADAVTDAKYFSLFTDYQNIRIQNIGKYTADIVKHNLTGTVIMQKFINFSCFV